MQNNRNGDIWWGGVDTYVRVTPLPDGGLHIAGFVAGSSTEQGVAGYSFHKNYGNNCILNVPPGTYKFALFGSGQGFENLLIQMYSSTSDSGDLSSTFWTNGNDGSEQQEIDNTIKRNYLRLRMSGAVSEGTIYNCVVYPMMMQGSEAPSNVKFMPYENTTINPNNIEVIKEKMLGKLIMENIYLFLKQLGSNYMFVGNEYPIKIGDRYNYIDLLLFNIEYELYVVVELKIDELKK